MRLDPRLIISFAVIAQERSFTRAAARLHVAQPWLSARIAKLEATLGFRLFHRTTRSVILTERGTALLPLAEEMLRLSHETDRVSLQLCRRETGVLRIGAAPSTKVISHRHELLNDFALIRSDITLELESAWSIPLLAKLDAGEIDLSFMLGHVDPARYERILLAQYGMAITVAPTHAWASREFLMAHDVAGSCVQVFTPSLNPGLWNILYQPLVEARCHFAPMPEMAEGAPMRMRSGEDIAAFFDFGADEPGGAEVVRIPLRSSVAVPFQLLRCRGPASPLVEAFWETTRRRAERYGLPCSLQSPFAAPNLVG